MSADTDPHTSAPTSGFSRNPRRAVRQNSWQPDFCVSGLLPLIKQNMIDVRARFRQRAPTARRWNGLSPSAMSAHIHPQVEEVMIRTASGPGGMAGPLRVDFDGRYHPHGCMAAYSPGEAAAAFARAEHHHRVNGW